MTRFASTADTKREPVPPRGRFPLTSAVSQGYLDALNVIMICPGSTVNEPGSPPVLVP